MGTTRIGMLTPSSNTALEPETYRMLTAMSDVSAHFTRIPVTVIGLGSREQAQFSAGPMLKAAALLGDAKVSALAWNGTSGSWLGPDSDRALAATIGEAAGVPATTSTLALLAALRAYGSRRIGMVTPYTRDVSDAIAEQYAKEGVTVVAERHLGIADNEAFARVPAGELSTLITNVAAAGVDAVAIVCTNVHGAPLAEPLERRLRVPVFDSVTATLWHCLMLAGADRPTVGFGSLLRSGGTRVALASVCERLLLSSGADRVTARLDLPALGVDVDRPCAEADSDGTSPLGGGITTDQRALDTVSWLAANRRPLVQPDFSREPRPPRALREDYGVRAQMLGPVIRDGKLTGWLSVHSRAERDWRPSDLRALEEATVAVHSALDQVQRHLDSRIPGPMIHEQEIKP